MDHFTPPVLRCVCFALTVLASAFSVSPARAESYLLQAGPMIGHVSDSSGVVWLRTKMGAAVSAVARQGDEHFHPSRIEDLSLGFQRIHFTGLAPDTLTEIELHINRTGDAAEHENLAFTTAPKPALTGKVRLGFGSCAKVGQFDGAPIFNAAADEKPDFFVFAGDNVYFVVGDGKKRHFSTTGPAGDWSSYEQMLARHMETRIHPDLDRLHRTIPAYAVWDDHDYGHNNADTTFPMKEEATLAFTQVWANPGYGTPETGGIFSSFRRGPVEVFLMDDRTFKYSPFRYDDVTPETGRIWGQAQLDWLKAGLRASTAPVKLIVNGTQFLGQDSPERAEGHAREARGEREELLTFLADERIGGVVFLTGDRHHSAVYQHAQPDGTLVIDLTSSPLQQNQEIAPYTGDTHPEQLWNMRGNNYGLVTIDIPEEGTGTIRFEIRGEDNSVAVVDGTPRTAAWQLDQLTY